MKMKKQIIALCIVAAVLSCNQYRTREADQDAKAEDSTLSVARNFFKPLPAVADNKDNPVTQSKVKLGKYLYYDTRLSKNGAVSCNTCHNLETYGVDHEAVSTGVGNKAGNRNSPTVFNAALHNMQFWDGRAKDVEAQAGMPILNPVEMAIPHKNFLVNRLGGVKLYQEMFKEAFPGEANPITYDNLEKAIGAFERTLLTPSRFDKYMNGDKSAITKEEKEGMKVFISSGCVACHNGVGVGGGSIQRFGVVTDYRTLTKSKTDDVGQAKITKNIQDTDKFKVAGLRNVAGTYPYFHDGSITTLDSAIIIMGKAQLNKTFSPEEVKQIIAFLNALSGDISPDAKGTPPELLTK